MDPIYVLSIVLALTGGLMTFIGSKMSRDIEELNKTMGEVLKSNASMHAVVSSHAQEIMILRTKVEDLTSTTMKLALRSPAIDS